MSISRQRTPEIGITPNAATLRQTSPTHPLRIAAIQFLNPAPLMYDFEYPPQNQSLAQRYTLQWMMPSACADALALPIDHPSAADIGLVPIATLATTPGLRIIPGCAIAAKGKIRSLLLVYPASLTLSSIRTIAADTSSRATVAYTRIMSHLWSPTPATFLQHPPSLDTMLQAADAALIIGDPALFALEDRQSRLARTGQQLIYLDLAEEWTALRNVPWISAVWAIRTESLKTSSRTLHEIAADFTQSRDHGLANIETLVSEWSKKLPLPAQTIREYLTENIFYDLDDECLNGLAYFYQLAAKYKILPATDLKSLTG